MSKIVKIKLELLLKKIFNENNLIIIIPAVIVILMITGFMIYGFRTPSRSEVLTTENLIEMQRQKEIEISILINSINNITYQWQVNKNSSDSSPITEQWVDISDDDLYVGAKTNKLIISYKNILYYIIRVN